MTKGKPSKDGKQCPGSPWDVFSQQRYRTRARRKRPLLRGGIICSLIRGDKLTDSCVYWIKAIFKCYCHSYKFIKETVVSHAFCTAHRYTATHLQHSPGVILGWGINMSQWLQQWHQERFHHPINNVALVCSETESQLFPGQGARTATIVSSHWKQGDVWHQAGVTHRVTDTLCWILSSHRAKTAIVAMGSHSFMTDY